MDSVPIASRDADRRPNLRDQQKAQTRERILEVAKQVFGREGYFGATVDQIVAEVGASRQTFYRHFKDKAEVLAELMATYSAGGEQVMERFPGPRPTIDAVRLWLLDFSAFLQREYAAFAILGEVAAHPATHAVYGTPTVDDWIGVLGGSAPAFAAATSDHPHRVEALARARLLIIEAIAAASTAWEQAGTDHAEMMLYVVASSFAAFTGDPRY